MKLTTDDHLIEQTLAGDTHAFGVLVERYQNFVFTIVVRMVKNRAVAEEVAQDSFIKAFQSLQHFRGESKFSSWLYSIAYRKALDALRKMKRKQTTTLVEEITEASFAETENALQLLVAKERAATIQKCIMELAEEEAAIVTLYYFEDYSVKEICQITSLSQDNVKIKLYRSRKKLFSLLKKHLLPEITQHNGKAI